MKEFSSLATAATETGKSHVSVIIATFAKKKKALLKKIELIGEKQCHNPLKCLFSVKGPKS